METGWTPFGECGEELNNLLNIARFLFAVRSGHISGPWPRLPPPAHKEIVARLATVKVEEENQQCAICLKSYEKGETVKKMPCFHKFHDVCILTWLNKTNSCPLCRHELMTDSPRYEAYKQKKRIENWNVDIDTIWNSLFS